MWCVSSKSGSEILNCILLTNSKTGWSFNKIVKPGLISSIANTKSKFFLEIFWTSCSKFRHSYGVSNALAENKTQSGFSFTILSVISADSFDKIPVFKTELDSPTNSVFNWWETWFWSRLINEIQFDLGKPMPASCIVQNNQTVWGAKKKILSYHAFIRM